MCHVSMGGVVFQMGGASFSSGGGGVPHRAGIGFGGEFLKKIVR